MTPALQHTVRILQPARRFAFVAAALLASCSSDADPPGSAATAVSAATTTPVNPAATTTATTVTPAAASSGQRVTSAVTLLTGDVVRFSQGGSAPVTVNTVPAPGREQVTFAVRVVKTSVGEDVIVVPSDALALLASGLVDEHLFNVSELVRQGFDDATSQTLPIIVTYRGVAPRSLAAVPARTNRHLGSIRGDALVTAKTDTNQVWSWLTGGGARGLVAAKALTVGVDKVWLDRRAQILLDQSAPQIGAPTVWASGYTGKGVTIAVLDTGLKFDHPDLVGKASEAVDFTDTLPDASDDVGHGTHVAGIITGSGAASGGRYRGIAPDVNLIIGKVCVPAGCPTSAIIAGMEWAASKAPIVSMSLGTTGAGDVSDPMSVAVDNLSAQYGTLFVIAAGNAGADFTVGSPGVANSALTVASVSKQDTISSFSSRGPRTGDYAVKPEIAAPGGLIVAARAKGTPVGDLDPIDDNYVRLSGTSMATPHVSAGAALLLQEHPDWTGPQLKAALMSTAKPIEGLRVVDEGAGRIDLVRATTQTVRATGSLSFGVMAYPHDGEVLTQTITYQNDGDAAVTLALALNAIDDKQAAAPAGLFTLPPQVVVPAHGTADVAVSAVGATAWTGLFSGLITASDATNRVETAIDVLEQDRRFNLTINVTDETGAPTVAVFAALNNVDDGTIHTLSAPSQTLSLPPGEYDALGIAFSSTFETMFVALPSIMLDSDKTVSVGVNAKPVSVTVDNPKAALAANSITLHSASRNGLGVSYLTLTTKPLRITPTAPITDHAFSNDYRAWLMPATVPTTTNPADHFIYNLVFGNSGGIADPMAFKVRTRDLATVLESYHNPGDAWGWRENAGSTPSDTAEYLTAWKDTMPSQRIEYYTTASTWEQSVMLFPNQPPQPFLSEISYGIETYAPGHFYEREWFGAPSGPSFGTGQSFFGAYRAANAITFYLAPFSWGEAGHIARTWPGTTTLSRDGQVLGTVAFSGFGNFSVPADPGVYTVTTHGVRNIPWSTINRGIDATWMFHSAPAADADRHNLPVYLVKASGLFDGNDAAPAGWPYLLSVEVQRQVGAPTTPITELGLEVSFDDGVSWHKTPVLGLGDRGLALVVHPSTPGTVSLRTHAKDAKGNSVIQTAMDAYRTAK